jgi:uncharacterized membrane protein SirB2
MSWINVPTLILISGMILFLIYPFFPEYQWIMKAFVSMTLGFSISRGVK